MKLLIIGGTKFVGRHLVEDALARGWEVTLFHRGQTHPELFPQVERVFGDRGTDLSRLAGRRWDAVVDTCGYVPRVVGLSAAALADAVGHYTFISSISVYGDLSRPGADESSPVATLEDPTVETVDGGAYGALKALCEQAAEAAMPGRVLVVRPGLIVGPHDPTDRFTYWVHRASAGGTLLAPEGPQVHVQFIDARDLAAWTLDSVAHARTGVYNATGPAQPLTLGELIEAVGMATGAAPDPVWASPAFLEAQGVSPWSDLPVWIPGDEDAGWAQADIRKAIRDGLTFRPLAETVSDTLAWASARPPAYEWQAGLRAEREAALLRAWRAEQR